MTPHQPPRADPDGIDPSESEVLRRELSTDWLSAGEVGLLLGKPPEEGSGFAKQLRTGNQIYAAWLQSAQRYVYPPWQFTRHGEPISAMEELLSLLRSPQGLGIALPSSGWGETEWFLSCHTLLDGRQPAEVLREDPALVLAVAREEFSEGRGLTR